VKHCQERGKKVSSAKILAEGVGGGLHAIAKAMEKKSEQDNGTKEALLQLSSKFDKLTETLLSIVGNISHTQK
jgi:hypothetical protein